MSIFATPVTQSDLINLQQAINANTNASQAASEAALINSGGDSVAHYATFGLIASGFGDITMGVYGVELGSPTIANFENVLNNFVIPQYQYGLSQGFNPTVYASEALGLALSGQPQFAQKFIMPTTQANEVLFVAQVSAATGINSGAIQGWLDNWQAFYTANPNATFGVSVNVAAAGAALGDAVGVAVANGIGRLGTSVDSNGHIDGLVANALIDKATGQYSAGVALENLPAHSLLQGEGANVGNPFAAARGGVESVSLVGVTDHVDHGGMFV